MKQWTSIQIMKGLQEMIPEITIMRKSDDHDGKKGGIWTSGEDDWIYKGIPPFNHNLEYGELPLSYSGYPYPKLEGMKVKEMYVYGIHREIYSWLEERGWYHEWYDPGTLFFWKETKESAEEIIENLENYHIYLDTHEIDGIEGEILKKLKEKFEEKND